MRRPGLDTRLIERTRELLRSRPREITYRTIEQDTGLNVEFLRMIAARRSTDASSSRVLTLYQYLSGKQLDI